MSEAVSADVKLQPVSISMSPPQLVMRNRAGWNWLRHGNGCQMPRLALALFALALTPLMISAEEARPRKIVLIAGDPDGHPANTHEYAKSVALVKQCLEASANTKGLVVEAHTGGWPQDESTLDTADTIVLITSGSDRVETNHPLLVGNRIVVVEKQMNRGCGLMTFHYSTFAPNTIGQRILEWVGGYFDYQSGPAANGWYSKIQFWNAEAKLSSPEHPVARGVKPFQVNEEFYYNIRFLENDQRLTPIVAVRPPGESQDHTVGWAVERKNGGRGFGFTGGHPFENWKNDDFRKLILNAICWTAHVEVPERGVQSVLPLGDAGKPSEGGTPTASPNTGEPSAGKFGRALDARRGGLAVKPNAAYHTPPWTVECWAKVEPGGFNILVAQSAKESNKHWELFTWHDNGTLTAYLPGCAPDHVRSDARVTDGQWHYLAMTFDGRTAKLFVDGKQAAATEIKCHEGRGSTGPLWIGAYPPGAIGCNGLIDEVRISKSIRQIDSVPQEPLAVDEQTIGMWRFDGKSLAPVTDESSLKADANSLSGTEPARQTEDHFFGWQETEGHDDRWQKTDIGWFFNGTIRNKDQVTARGLCVRVGTNRQAALIYDTQLMNVACAWKGKFLNFDPGRFGLIGMPSVAGEPIEIAQQQWLIDGKPQTPRYRGLFVHGERVVLSYEVGNARVLESPWVATMNDGDVLKRLFEVAPHAGEITFKLGESAVFTLPPTDQTVRATVKLFGDDRFEIARNTEDLSALTDPGPPQWNEPLVTTGKRSEETGAYVVDTLTLPFENPYHALLFTSGLDFVANGDAAVCTAHGDVWRVSGIDDDLRQLHWKRFATGLYQPLGLKIVDNRVYVLGRDQITRLHDTNSDGEADFYENFNSDSPTSAGGHDYSTCLETDREGNFYFLHAIDGLVQISPDGKQRKIIATGFRNPNGLGVSPDGVITVSPQEGNWTPASSIIAVKPDGYYGFGGPKFTPNRPLGYDPPMVWLPRPLDNSSGGQVWTTSDRFGPLGNQLLHLSYGRSSMMLVLRDEVNGIKQGAVIPLPLPFNSGIMRGRMNPSDGQLYVVGQQGWVSNAVNDGCFERVRYVNQAPQLPVGIRYHEDGIAVTFLRPLERVIYEEAGGYSAQQWRYRYASDYGSADYKVSAESEEGHDELKIRAAKVLDDERTVFLAIDDLRPTMQIQITFPDDAGKYQSFGQTLAGTIHQLHPRLFATPLEVAASGNAVSLEVEARLEDGLIIEYFADARENAEPRAALDVAVSRLAALHATAAERTRPWSRQPWTIAKFSGYLRAPVSGQYVLHSNQRSVTIYVNGQSVRGDGEGAFSVRLSKGLNPISIVFAASAEGPSAFALDWSSSNIGREPIPPTALCHDPTENSLPRFDELRRGRQLFAEQMCARCHAPASWPERPMTELARTGPSLAGIASVRKREWIMDAHHRLHASFFPDNDAGRQAGADVQAYLETLQSPILLDTAETSDELVAEGEEKFERLGCIACHTAMSIDEPTSVQLRSLDHVTAKYKPGALKAYLLSPHKRDEWSEMPDFQLSDREATALVAYLASEASAVTVKLSKLTGDAERGKLAFRARCAQCHATDTIASDPRSIPVFGATKVKGCLALDPKDRGASPVYYLDAEEQKALAAYLATNSAALGGDSLPDAAHRLMQRYQCSSCHSYGNDHGKLAEIALELGSTGLPPDRIPNLTWAGEKLRVEWMERLIAGKIEHRSRPWFDARMPAFPPAVAHAISHGLAAAHGLPPEDAPFSPDPRLVEIGKKLSDKNGGLDCRQCHSLEHLTPRQPNDAQGISFLHVPHRVRRGYYDRWMRDPLRIDPATKMPRFAQDGKHTVLKNVLDGEAEAQFDSIWHYLRTIPSE